MRRNLQHRVRAVNKQPDDAHLTLYFARRRANLPGSTRTHDLLTSWSRMVSELFKHSTNKEMLLNVPEHLRDVHKARKRVRIEEQGVMLPSPVRHKQLMPTGLWDADDDGLGGTDGSVVADFGFNDDDLDAIDLL